MFNKCNYCNYYGVRKDFEIDHQIPVSRSPLATLLMPNLELICSGCNRQKSNKTPYEYRVWRIMNPALANFGPMNQG